jgi:hypothetical protein
MHLTWIANGRLSGGSPWVIVNMRFRSARSSILQTFFTSLAVLEPRILAVSVHLAHFKHLSIDQRAISAVNAMGRR